MKCSGAGVVPIFIKENKVYIVTFIDQQNMASDAGGKVDGNYTSDEKIIKKTALRELFEESSGLIKLKSLKESISFDIKNKDNFYRLFFVIINKINFNHFDKNLNKFNLYKLNPFNEMYSIKLLDTSTIKFDNNDILVNTIEDDIVKISYRFKFVLYKVFNKFKTFKNFYSTLKIKKHILKKNIIDINSKEYNTHIKFKIKDIVSYQS